MRSNRMGLLLVAIGFSFSVSLTANADLVGLWRFDSDVSPQPDATGNGQDAALEGDVVWANDSERGGVMEFDGDQDYLLVEDTDLLSVEGDLTIAAWANFAQFDTWNSIVAKGGVAHLNYPSPFDVYTARNGDGRVSMYVGNDDVIAQVFSDLPPEPEVWTHIAITATEDGEIIHYLDGELNGEGFVDAPKGDADEPLYIGSRADFVTNMDGLLDDVAIFNEVLSQDQIQTIMTGDFSAWGIGGATRLQAGDANQDLSFDQRDIVAVQIAAKYLTGQAATWGEGDWDAAPGGEPGSPPPGDGLFNQLDVIAALNNGLYLTGPYAAVVAHPSGDGNATLVYNPGTGELAVQVGATELTSINIDSASSIFTGDAAQNLGGSFDNDSDNNIFKATFGSSFGSLSFGNVAQTGLSEDFVLNDLTVIGSLAGGGDLGNVDLIYVPEPASLILLVMGLLLVALRRSYRAVR